MDQRSCYHGQVDRGKFTDVVEQVPDNDGIISVSINLSFRISMEFLVTEKEVLLVNVGDHQALYGKK